MKVKDFIKEYEMVKKEYDFAVKLYADLTTHYQLNIYTIESSGLSHVKEAYKYLLSKEREMIALINKQIVIE